MLGDLILLALYAFGITWVYHWPIWWRSHTPRLGPGQVFKVLPKRWWQSKARWVPVYHPTPMQAMGFTPEDIGLLLKYKIRWTSVEQAKKVLEQIRRTEPR